MKKAIKTTGGAALTREVPLERVNNNLHDDDLRSVTGGFDIAALLQSQQLLALSSKR